MRLNLDTKIAAALVAGLLALPSAAAAANVTVGNGTPASCTQLALQSALATAGSSGGGTVKFFCGVAPVTIPLTATLTDSDWGLVAIAPPTNTAIDGGGLVTFARIDAISFLVRAGVSFKLQRIGLTAAASLSAFEHSVINLGALTVDTASFADDPFGAIESYGPLVVKNSVFSRTGIGSPIRAAIVNGGAGTIDHALFSQNIGPAGGAVDNTGALAVRNSIFYANTAEEGGAIANEFGTLSVDNTTFADNLSAFPGGAVANFGPGLTITNSTFSGNRAGVQGGGAIWITGSATSTVDRCQFLGNEARDNSGGAIRSSAPLVVKRSAFFDNQAEQNGGAIDSGNLDISGSALARNHAQLGGGISSQGASTISRTVITANLAEVDGGGVYVTGGIAPVLVLSVVAANTPNDIVVVP